MLRNWPMFHGVILISPSRFPWISPWISQRGVVEKVVKDERTPRALPSANAWGAPKRKKEKNIEKPSTETRQFLWVPCFFLGVYLFFGASLEYHLLEMSNMLILGIVSGNVTNSLWRGIFLLGIIFLGGASICAFAFAFAAFDFAFAAFASFARAFVTSALLSAHLLLSCFRVVFCLSFCRTSKCNACVCPACLLYVCFGCAVAARWGPCKHMYSFMLERGDINRCQIPQTGVRYHNRNQKADRAPVRSTSPTSPPKSCGASRWTSHTASPSISPNYARSSQEQQELRKVLREAGCGPYAPIMMATLPMLATLELRDYIAIFRMQLCKWDPHI